VNNGHPSVFGPQNSTTLTHYQESLTSLRRYCKSSASVNELLLIGIAGHLLSKREEKDSPCMCAASRAFGAQLIGGFASCAACI
jgi:hypothetical protein